MLSKHSRIKKTLIVQIEFNFCMVVNQFYLLRLLVCLRRVLISANTYPLKQTKQTLSMSQNRCFFPAHVNLARKSLSCISREVFTRDEQTRIICVIFATVLQTRTAFLPLILPALWYLKIAIQDRNIP